MVWTADAAQPYPYDVAAAIEHFRSCDPILHAVVDQVGPYRLDFRAQMTPFEALLRSIVYQQLSGRAADTILGRLLALFGDDFPGPEQIIAMDFNAIRQCGMSQAKTRAVKDLAQKQAHGQLPAPGAAADLSDAELIEAYTQVRGIGPWTVEMLLIFNLGRADILPVTDLGIRRGFMIASGDAEMPSPKQLAAHGEKWRPYRSIASWYLWRAADPEYRAPQAKPADL